MHVTQRPFVSGAPFLDASDAIALQVFSRRLAPSPLKVFFCRGGTVLGPTAAVDLIVWEAPYACTVTAVKGYRSGGTGATVNARKNGASAHLSSDLSISSVDTWMTGSGLQNTPYAPGDKLEIRLMTITGTPTQVAVQVNFERV
jgi:hypothetical protein